MISYLIGWLLLDIMQHYFLIFLKHKEPNWIQVKSSHISFSLQCLAESVWMKRINRHDVYVKVSYSREGMKNLLVPTSLDQKKCSLHFMLSISEFAFVCDIKIIGYVNIY